MYALDGSPQLVYYISERRVAADPREAVDHEALGLPEARPPLGPDPAQWLGTGNWAGKVEQIRWEPGACQGFNVLKYRIF